jgi:hypothetical protein
MARAKQAEPDRVHFWCPGCDDAHGIRHGGANDWIWNGDLERPTFTPSVLVKYGVVAGVAKACHSFVTDGRIQFLADSFHTLAGQTVDLPEWPLGG